MGDMADAAIEEFMDEVYDEETDTFVDAWSKRKWEEIPRGSGPCPLCRGQTVKKTGRNGPFYGCTAYPQCKGSRFAYEWEQQEWEDKMSQGYTPRPGSFTLFRNKHKQPGDKKPDYTGNGAGLDGQPLQIAGWIKEGKSGEKFMSIAISEPQPKADAPPPAAEPSDDCPF